MLDLTKPITLDGVLLTVIDPNARFDHDRPTFCATLAEPDRTRKLPDFWKWHPSAERNEHRYFFTDTGEHVYSAVSSCVVNVPEALKAGDHVRYRRVKGQGIVDYGGATGTVTVIMTGPDTGHAKVRWDVDKRGPSMPFLVNLEKITMTKPLDTAKPLEVGVGQRGPRYDVPFITTTSEDHILVGKFPDSRADWFIFTADGQFVRSSDNSGSGLTLRNKSVETVHYQRTISASARNGQYIMDPVYETLEQARVVVGNLPMQIIKVTKTDGVITAVELVK